MPTSGPREGLGGKPGQSRCKISSGAVLSIFTAMVIPPAILSAGTKEQEKKYIEAVSSGEKIISFWLSEHNAGSYNLGMEATAILEGGHYIINGNKIFVTDGLI